MDSVTHISLGICVGEILLTKKLGKKALLWGAIAQNLPDIDTFSSLFLSEDKVLLIHRGITHSLLFAMIIGLGLAFLAQRVHHKQHISFATLAFFFCFQLALHDLLDTCNSYGTGLLEPFSHHRFSINVLYVADPLFTISLLIAAIYLVFKPANNTQRLKWAAGAIIIAEVYLCFASFNKVYVDTKSEGSFTAEKIKPSTYISTPTPLNCLLWFVVAKADSGYYTGYRSIFDKRSLPVKFQYHPQNKALRNKATSPAVTKNLVAFAHHYYTLTENNHVVYLNVLRFGQVHGWVDNDAPFAFSYPLVDTGNQALLLQKGRLAGWNITSVKQYFNRIVGKQTP